MFAFFSDTNFIFSFIITNILLYKKLFKLCAKSNISYKIKRSEYLGNKSLILQFLFTNIIFDSLGVFYNFIMYMNINIYIHTKIRVKNNEHAYNVTCQCAKDESIGILGRMNMNLSHGSELTSNVLVTFSGLQVCCGNCKANALACEGTVQRVKMSLIAWNGVGSVAKISVS